MKKYKILILTLFLCTFIFNTSISEAKADWQYLGNTTDINGLKCTLYFDNNKIKWRQYNFYDKNATVLLIDTTIQAAAHNEEVIDPFIKDMFITKVRYKIYVVIQNNNITKYNYKVLNFWIGDEKEQKWTKQKMTDYEKKNFTNGMEKDISTWLTQKILIQTSRQNEDRFLDMEL